MNNGFFASLNQRQQLVLLNTLIVVAIVLFSFYVFLIIAGYGNISLKGLPVGAIVRLNGHTISSRSIRVRPGSYALAIISPDTMPYQSNVTVSLLGTTTISPSLQSRSPKSIFSSLFGAAISTSIPPDPANSKEFSDGWLVASLNPGGVIAAAHYDNTKSRWVLEFASAGDTYPKDIDRLPHDVAIYTKALEAQGGQGF